MSINASYLITFILLSWMAVVKSECANACNGHGKCTSYDMCICNRNWQSNDCSERVCQFGLAHVDTPKGDLDMSGSISNANEVVAENNFVYPYGTTEQFPQSVDSDLNPLTNTAHYYMECSNKGVCNRDSGECECYDGYDGVSCQRASCPNACSGHGVCKSISQLADAHNENVYKLWDKDSTMGCECDSGYYGADCSLRHCSYGVDPLYLDDSATVKYPIFNFATLATATTSTLSSNDPIFNDGTPLSGQAYWAIRFYDVYGEDWLTDPIKAGATCDDVTDALYDLPNNAIPADSLVCSRVARLSAVDELLSDQYNDGLFRAIAATTIAASVSSATVTFGVDMSAFIDVGAAIYSKTGVFVGTIASIGTTTAVLTANAAVDLVGSSGNSGSEFYYSSGESSGWYLSDDQYSTSTSDNHARHIFYRLAFWETQTTATDETVDVLTASTASTVTTIVTSTLNTGVTFGADMSASIFVGTAIYSKLNVYIGTIATIGTTSATLTANAAVTLAAVDTGLGFKFLSDTITFSATVANSKLAPGYKLYTSDGEFIGVVESISTTSVVLEKNAPALVSSDKVMYSSPESAVLSAVGTLKDSASTFTSSAAPSGFYVRGYIYNIKFQGNPGVIQEPEIEIYLDGKSPSLVAKSYTATIEEKVITKVWTDGQYGEFDDYFADHCDNVQVTIKHQTGSPYSATSIIGGMGISYLYDLTAAEALLLKSCIASSDFDATNNLEIYDWDFGSEAYPHIIKLVRSVTTYTDGGYYAVIYADTDCITATKNEQYGTCSAAYPTFRILNPYYPADELQTDQFEIYTTTGTLAQVSGVSEAIFNFASKQMYMTNINYDINKANSQFLFDGDVSCEVGDNGAKFYSGSSSYGYINNHGSDATDLTSYHCLNLSDIFTVINWAQPQFNPQHINLYTVERTFTTPYDYSLTDFSSLSSGAYIDGIYAAGTMTDLLTTGAIATTTVVTAGTTTTITFATTVATTLYSGYALYVGTAYLGTIKSISTTGLIVTLYGPAITALSIGGTWKYATTSYDKEAHYMTHSITTDMSTNWGKANPTSLTALTVTTASSAITTVTSIATISGVSTTSSSVTFSADLSASIQAGTKIYSITPAVAFVGTVLTVATNGLTAVLSSNAAVTATGVFTYTSTKTLVFAADVTIISSPLVAGNQLFTNVGLYVGTVKKVVGKIVTLDNDPQNTPGTSETLYKSTTGSFRFYKFFPATASTYTYVAECSNRGTCDESTGLCNCFAGYTQGDCSEQSSIAL